MKCNIYGESKDNQTSETINGMYDAVLKVYGKKYASEINIAANRTIFYECRENELLETAIQKIFNNALTEEDKRIFSKATAINLSQMINGKTVKIIVYNPRKIDYKQTLCHEFYGHSVFGLNNINIKRNGKYYQRNGICLLSDSFESAKNRCLNEGFIDYMVQCIMREYLNNPFYQYKTGSLYDLYKEYAATIVNRLGMVKTLNSLINGTSDIENCFGKNFVLFNENLEKFSIDPYNYDIENVNKLFRKFIHNTSSLTISKEESSKYLREILNTVPQDRIKIAIELFESGLVTFESLDMYKDMYNENIINNENQKNLTKIFDKSFAVGWR